MPMWGEYKLSDVRTVAVESWLQSVPLSDGSRAKIRNVMSALFSHAMRWELYDRNPITLVRQSAKRESLPDVLTAEEIRSLLSELKEPYRTLVFLAATTGLRASELLALQWQDVDFDAGQIRLSRGIVDQKITTMKTEASRKSLPLTTELALVLANWRAKCTYNQSHDWVFASLDKKGTQPLWPENILRRHVRPAVERAGITKQVGFHTFRHSFATILTSNKEDVKTAQELLRHANSRITMDIYTQAINSTKVAAQEKLAGMFVPLCSHGSA
jgi:integrase